MPRIEVLTYSPKNMQDFITFCVEGKQEDGVFETDKTREVRGVMSWLHGREVPEAHFFHTPPADPPSPQLFMALVQKPDDEDQDMPWFSTTGGTIHTNIAGIDKLLNLNGLIGEVKEFSLISDVLTTVKKDDELDNKFKAGRARVQKKLKALEAAPAKQKEFLAALRSDFGSKPTEVFQELAFSL